MMFIEKDPINSPPQCPAISGGGKLTFELLHTPVDEMHTPSHPVGTPLPLLLQEDREEKLSSGQQLM